MLVEVQVVWEARKRGFVSSAAAWGESLYSGDVFALSQLVGGEIHNSEDRCVRFVDMRAASCM